MFSPSFPPSQAESFEKSLKPSLWRGGEKETMGNMAILPNFPMGTFKK